MLKVVCALGWTQAHPHGIDRIESSLGGIYVPITKPNKSLRIGFDTIYPPCRVIHSVKKNESLKILNHYIYILKLLNHYIKKDK